MPGPVLVPDAMAVQRAAERAAREPGDTRPVENTLELIPEQWRIARDENFDVQQDRLREKYDPVIEALLERGVDRRAITWNEAQFGEVPLGDFNRTAIWAEIRRARERDPEAFADLPKTREEFERAELTRDGARQRDLAEVGRAGTGAQIASGLVGGGAYEMTQPINVATLPVGGFGKNVLTRILTEGLVQAGVAGLTLPDRIGGRAAMGEETTAGDIALDLGGAFVAGAAIRGGIEAAPATGRAIGDAFDKAGRAIDPDWDAKQLARAFRQMVPENLRTPEQEAALHILTRQAEIADASPFVRTAEGIEAHTARLQTAIDALDEGRLPTSGEIAAAASRPLIRVAPQAMLDAGEREAIKASIRGPESGGDPNAENAMGSSASGLYQFVEGTFTRLYQREFGVGPAEAQRAWNTVRKDLGVQERLMDRLLDENAAALAKAGFEADAGNLYLAHFAGARKAIELLEADPSMPVARFFSDEAVRMNPTYLGGGRTVGEAIDTIRGKVGDPAARTPRPVDDVPMRNPDLDAERPVSPLVRRAEIGARSEEIGGELGPLIGPLEAIALGSRRSLNQVDALAEELGASPSQVRAALEELVVNGTITRNTKTGAFMRKAAAPITLANTRRPRTLIEFLAERGGLNDYGGELQARGIRPGDRRFGQRIIRNVRQEDGSMIAGEGEFGLDTAFRDAREAGYFPEFAGRAEGDYASSLDEGALLLEAIDEELAGLPRYRMDDWDRLGEYELTGSTEEIYGGFVRGEPGDEVAAQSLRADFEQAWIDFGNDPADLDAEFIDRAAELFESGEAFLPEQAIAMAVREDYEDTLRAALEEGLAKEYPDTYDPWHPGWQEEIDRRLADELARADADGAARGGSDGEPGVASARGADGAADESGRPDDTGQRRELTEAEADRLAAARPRSDHADLPPDPDPRFAEPDGEGIRATSESVWHDIEAETPDQTDFAAPTAGQRRTAMERQTEGGIRPTGATRAPGEDGGLFDTRDTTGDLFDMDDGKGPRSAAAIRAELDQAKAGIEEIRKCLK